MEKEMLVLGKFKSCYFYILMFFCWTFLIVGTLALLFDAQRSIAQSLLNFL